MVFSSTEFLFLFLPILLILYYFPLGFFKNQTYRNVLLLLVSLFFYAWGEPIFVLVMILSILLNWIFGLLIGKATKRKTKKIFLVCSVSFNLLLLFVFKYVSFLIGSIGAILGLAFSLQIELPIGISFFTFQALSYIFDVYYGKVDYQKSLLHIALYISFFPQLVAGPIVRYLDIENEICNRATSNEDFFEGIKRFVYGLSKKAILANAFGLVADQAFLSPDENTVVFAWFGAIAYTLQIYFDFSGYSDMAIGLGRMFGFHFSENFNYPYVANSVTNFWRRWHISLSSWFKDYVYIPLGGNRCSTLCWVRNLFIVWALTGIWHGANWTFLVWGMVYFVILLLEKRFNFVERLGVFSHMYTMLIVILAWVIFKSVSLTECLSYFKSMFGLNSNQLIDNVAVEIFERNWRIAVIGVIATTPVWTFLKSKIKNTRFEWIESIFILVLFVYSLFEIVSSTYNPFIYFNF